ncbi:MAG: hypothetical protein V1724_08990 [Chloroflexota bacterium]
MSNTARQIIPEWLPEPKTVFLKCDILPRHEEEEVTVILSVSGRRYAISMQENLVDRHSKCFEAMIIAKVDGGFIVDLPSQTLLQGSRLFIPTDELARLSVKVPA